MCICTGDIYLERNEWIHTGHHRTVILQRLNVIDMKVFMNNKRAMSH